MRHLILNLEAPLLAFGGETIDNLGVIRPFPAASMLTGLFANALGWRRIERERHQRLQDRLVFAARIDREPAGGVRMTDYQTVKMADSVDLFVQNNHWVIGWTTRGAPDVRRGALGGAGSGPFTHQRYRDYYADMRVTVALRLRPDDESPTLDELASGLDEPMRPLFIGRKPCLPSTPLAAGFSDGATALAALLNRSLDKPDNAAERVRTLWPEGEGKDGIAANREYMLTDGRNWISGLHGGGRWVCEVRIPRDQFAANPESVNSESVNPAKDEGSVAI